MKPLVFALVLPMALAGCASLPPPALAQCPKPPKVDHWILEPTPPLLPLLHRIIWPSGTPSN